MTTRWAPTDIELIWIDGAPAIRLTTSYPAHLFLRHTTTEPVKTSIPRQKRGALWYYDNKLCFVAYQDCEQTEPGDTLTHSFTCDIFAFCIPVWYYFWGTINGQPSPSNTAIMSAHLTWPAPPVCNMPAPSKTLVGVVGIAMATTINLPSKTLVSADGIAKSPALNTPTKTLTI